MNWSAAEMDEVPPEVVTVMSTVPDASAGEVTVQLVVVQLTDVPAVPPNLTEVLPVTKPMPPTVTTVPPRIGPAEGVTELTAEAVSNVN